MYKKRILNSTVIANIEVCFIRMQCAIRGLICNLKRFNLIIISCTALNICLF